jgi:hypothetical protein
VSVVVISFTLVFSTAKLKIICCLPMMKFAWEGLNPMKELANISLVLIAVHVL